MKGGDHMYIHIPCHHCTDRHFCCHATCAKYAAYKAQLADIADKKEKERDQIAFMCSVFKTNLKKERS